MKRAFVLLGVLSVAAFAAAPKKKAPPPPKTRPTTAPTPAVPNVAPAPTPPVEASPDVPRAAPTPTAVVPSTLSAGPSLTKLTTPPPEGATACASCHATSGWSNVKFNHDATGFPLKGKHARVGCKQCHATEFTAPIARGCAGCHVDAHGGDLGQRCESCHTEQSWESQFTADAHRRTNFPLLGGHATLPCVECHVESRERRFSRPAVGCVSCHQGDLARTAAGLVDHSVLQFGTECVSCHSGVRFKPARYPGHEACFPLLTGSHVNLGCSSCHTGSISRTGNRCEANSVTCTGCHAHQCSGPGGSFETDQQHASLPAMSYRCADEWCAGCHKTQGATP